MATHWPKEASPHWPHHREGALPPTGHLTALRTLPPGPMATHWPPTGHLLAIRGGPPTGQRGGPDWPPDGVPSPGPPPTGHLREPKTDWAWWRRWPPTPHQPIGRPSDGEGPKAGLPYPDWAPTGQKGAPPLATYWPSPALPHSPDFSGSGGPGRGGGLFACKGWRTAGARANQTPLGDPLAPTPTPHSGHRLPHRLAHLHLHHPTDRAPPDRLRGGRPLSADRHAFPTYPKSSPHTPIGFRCGEGHNSLITSDL